MTTVAVAVSLSAIIILCLAVLVFFFCQRSGRCQKEEEEEATGNYKMYICLIVVAIGFVVSLEITFCRSLKQNNSLYF